ncbi:MAG: bifunctional tRNA (5-methylaminomethyl-2-thiouridine)(34)-methyltransferase MnmD/FAD-dependent 5-carboxymethylaminomethyl-2-thiouridine(34) oxidoreductase MnmC [Lentisphaerales bacterium]|nr:bifunctional tRNA (5-methylaminomethyl-2-thiouridine)(34)-methyltransferase MnmD/FAD-dependent 5-carboxymethylaminomethyl-2-thiouridine(34) oxidoreductase MnmC [Lentisphaerales bacterium]
MDDLTWTEEGTLYSEAYGDIYYHDGQGLAETEYVFLAANKVQEKLQKAPLVIGELGFGTGLNFLTTWKAWKEQAGAKRFTFISCEKHPLDLEHFEKAHAAFPELAEFSSQLRAKLPPITSGFHFLEFENGQVSLLLMYGDAVDVYKQFEGKIDCWYLDGFAPSRNPEMWSEALFLQMARHSHENTSLATFTAAGFVRRGLESVGFSVERIKGFGNKKHMTVGTFTGHVIGSPVLPPWFQNPPRKKIQTAAVIGAGIAGLNTAYFLARSGIDVTVYDKNSKVASEASGNRWGMMYPLISKKQDRLGTFTKAGCAFTKNQLHDLGVSYREGLLEFITEERKDIMIKGGEQRLPKSYLERLAPEQINEEFGLNFDYEAAFHKQAVTFSPQEYAGSLVKKGGFECSLDSEVTDFQREDDAWHLEFKNGESATVDAVVVTAAFNTKNFERSSFLPMRKARGQVVHIPKEQVSVNFETGMNYVNYLVQESSGDYVLGATFQVDDHDEGYRVEDSKKLLDSFEEAFPGLIKPVDPESLNGRVCFRCVQQDYFPQAGPVYSEEEYKEAFVKVKHGRPHYKYPAPPYQEGLYVLAGLGARGLSTASMLAAYLAKMICDGVNILPESHITAVHPSRYIIRQLKRA